MSKEKKIVTKLEESQEATTVYNVPFPKELDNKALKSLKDMEPIIIKFPYQTDYIHSYGQDSPWFAAAANGHLLGTKCKKCGHVFATPKLACMECGGVCNWIELPKEGKIHSYTICHFGAEAFLDQCPYVLCMVEFKGADTLFLSQLVGCEHDKIKVGMKVKARFRRLSQLKPTDVYFIPA